MSHKKFWCTFLERVFDHEEVYESKEKALPDLKDLIRNNPDWFNEAGDEEFGDWMTRVASQGWSQPTPFTSIEFGSIFSENFSNEEGKVVPVRLGELVRLVVAVIRIQHYCFTVDHDKTCLVVCVEE